MRLLASLLCLALSLAPALAGTSPETAAEDPNANATFDASTTAAPVDCEGLAESASLKYGLPPGLLASIARVESGRRGADGTVHAWPWTLDEAGRGSFYADKEAAMAHLQAAIDGGATNVDVGCMQLNYKWHARAFSSLDLMMDPVANTDYAARFLKALIDKFGNAEAATAVYHSLDPARGVPYQQKVAAVLAGIGPVTPADPSLVEPGMALVAAGPDPGMIEGILMVARGPLFAALAGPTLLQPHAALVALNGAAAPGTPEAPVGQSLPPPPEDLLVLALPKTPRPGKGDALLAREDLSPDLAAQWSDLESLRRALAP
jgi:hypothetical protein